MNKMKKNLKLVLLLFAGITFLASCTKTTSSLTGDWKTQASFQGLGRNGAVVFVIGTKAYVGTGYNRDNNKWLNDFWVYDAVKNNWTLIAPFPGVGRVNGVAFAANGKGYVGSGYDGVGIRNVSDFYSYDPTANAWTQIANLPGPTRRGAVSFSVNNVGYVGTGLSTDTTGITNGLGDFYAYNAGTNVWNAVSGYPGLKVYNAFSFVINNIAYVGGGAANSTSNNQFFQYNAAADTWIKKARLDSNNAAVPRYSCAAFSQNNLGYIANGTGSQSFGTCFEYTPSNDTWNQKNNFEGSGRYDCISFSMPTGLTGSYTSFIGLGTQGASSTPFYDLWSWSPTVARIDNN